MSHSLRIPLLVALGLGVGTAAPGGVDATESDARECVSAAISDIAFDKRAEVDEIRVQLLPSSPRDAAVQVTVETDDSDRVVAIDGEHYKALQFAPAMSASEYRISLFPGNNDKKPACVQSVELLSDGASVAYFRP